MSKLTAFIRRCLKRLVRHQQSRIPNDLDIPNVHPVPDAIYARTWYRTVSALLAEAERDNATFEAWDKTSLVFLLPLLSLWQSLGRPEIKWPTLPGLPSSDSGRCVLEAYLDRAKDLANTDISDGKNQ